MEIGGEYFAQHLLFGIPVSAYMPLMMFVFQYQLTESRKRAYFAIDHDCASVAAGRARPGRGYFLLGLALAGPHFFVRGRPVAWPAVGRVGRAKSGQAGYMAGLALAGLWPD